METDVSVTDGSIVSALTDRWWTLVVRGIAAVVFGIIAFAMPGSALLSLVLVFGTYAIVDGAFNLVVAVRRGRAGLRWGWFLFHGIVSILAGVLTFVWPAITGMVLLMIIAAWAIVTGVAEIAIAVKLRRRIQNEWMLVASGILSIVFGALVLVFPRTGALSVIWMIGLYAVVFGGLMIGLGLRLNNLRRARKTTIPSGGAPSPA